MIDEIGISSAYHKTMRSMKNRFNAFILVVEDEEETANSISIILRKAGYQVECVQDGLGAVNRIAACKNSSRPVDLVLTDIQMPVLTGTELMEELKKTSIDIPVLVITGYSDEETLYQLESVYAVPYMIKPFKPLELLEQVGNALKLKTGRMCS